MKNLNAIVKPEEISEYILDLWRTDIFKRSHMEEEGYISRIIDKLSERPVVFFEMDDASLEWSHFTTWMGAYSLREYDNDAVHDLYYLHEFWHGATMEYYKNATFSKWYKKMCENEMQASVHSEAYVYFVLEGLREQSFDFEIWVDRFDKEEILKRRDPAKSPEQHMFELLYTKRKEVMKSPDPFDFPELQIHFYGKQNMQWANVWKDSYREVESHMADYLDHAEEDPVEAVKVHLEWLEGKKDDPSRPQEGVTPFPKEARAFAQVVDENKKRQGNDILKS